MGRSLMTSRRKNFALTLLILFFFSITMGSFQPSLAEDSSVIHDPAYYIHSQPIPHKAQGLAYPIVDTGQDRCYDDSRELAWPGSGGQYFGQDAQYQGNDFSYRDNGDGTVSDHVTGLMWTKAVDSKKLSLKEALVLAPKLRTGGYSDWRVPTVKELYSLMDFRGCTGFSGSRDMSSVPSNSKPFMNTRDFDFKYGDTSAGERYIDAQWLTSTRYVSTTMDGADTLFGVNFADGRIKGYGYSRKKGGAGPSGRRGPGGGEGQSRNKPKGEKKFYVRYVRGPQYGVNDFRDNGDGTITDRATGLTWMKEDSHKSMTWKQALAYAENLSLAGHDDWRLPNAKELQSIVDYTRSPDTTNSPAIDPIFSMTRMKNEAGKPDYPWFWTSTTHLDGPDPGRAAAYVAFGRALGKMHGTIMDVHGAGAQRSDPKTGEPTYRGPQGDRLRITNFVRCVRGGTASPVLSGPEPAKASTGSTGRKRRSTSEGRKSRPAQGSPQLMFINRLDIDGDGLVSRDEFDGPADRFDDHDQDGDGYISAEEAPSGPPRNTQRPPRRR